MHPLQEKLQTIMPTRIESENEQWAPAPSRPYRQDMASQMPNLNIEAMRQMPLNLAGMGDVSKDTNPEALCEGFTRRDMGNCDDQYTGEHIDQFYGDSGGFCERNNVLDRL